MCMFTGGKVDGCQQSLIVISGTSSCSHSNASTYFTFLSTQLCREVLAWRIEVEGRVAESYTFLFSVSSSHQFFPCDFNLILKRHQTVINRMSGYIIPLMEWNPLQTNAPKNRIEHDKEHIYIKLVIVCLFDKISEFSKRTYISCESVLKFSLPQVISDLIIVLEKIIINLCMLCNPFPTWLSHCSYAIITSFN